MSATSQPTKRSYACTNCGISLRNKKDLECFIMLRLTHSTERLGFCLVSLADSDNTFIDMMKKFEEEKHKLNPTAKGEQLKMFLSQTFLAVLPATEYTYHYNKKVGKKILGSLETPAFLKMMVRDIMKEAEKYASAKSEEFQKWKRDYFENKWFELNADKNLLDQLVTENFDSQNRCNANVHIPPTPPIITYAMYYVAIKIIEEATKRAPNSTAIYFNLPFSILQNKDLRNKILDYCAKSRNRIIILQIQGLDKLTDPDKEDERDAFSDIQHRLCELRKYNKCTILINGGKLTIPSLVRGFDIVTNDFSGRKKQSGGKIKKDSTEPNGYTQYFIKENLIFYTYKKMIEYAENQLKLTNGEHGLTCELPCCKEQKSLKDISKEVWNYSITRPHYALNMNDIATKIVRLINNDQIQQAKDIILRSNLCVLKRLIPDV